jgi:hypothetical protein
MTAVLEDRDLLEIPYVEEPPPPPPGGAPLTYEEACLAAILLDPSGLDQAEFLLVDQSKPDLCYRAKPFQWPWWRARDARQMDQCSRDVGKSEGMMLRCLVFSFLYPGEEMTIFTPEFTHINRIAERIEARIVTSWFYRALTRGGRSGITHRPFCVGGGQLVATRRGQVPIEQVRVGDEVLTHRNRWRKVTGVANNGERSVVRMKGMGHPGLILTEDHKLYARRQRQVERPGSPRAMIRQLGEPEWIAPESWRTGDPATNWGTPAAVEPLEMPSDITLMKRGGSDGATVSVVTPEFMWFLGHYLAEGCLAGSGQVRLGIHHTEAEEVLERLAAAGLHGSLCRPGKAGQEISIGSRPLHQWIATHVPGLSHEKDIPPWAFGMKEELRRALLDGYFYGDGHLTKNGHQAPRTVSRRLAVGVRLLAVSLGWSAGITEIPAANRVVKSGPQAGVIHCHRTTYAVHVNMDDQATQRHVHTRFVDDIAWCAATKIEPAGTTTVYDLEVEEDHSFVVDGIIVHNCVFWQNGARLISALPQRSGIGAKGAHSVVVEIDEAQDLSPQAWKEIPNTISWEKPNAKWYIHGVSRGVRDDFHDYSTKPELGFTVHRITQMHREDWTEERRAQLIEEFGGSVDSPDYKRNVKGEHGDTSNVIFILQNLMAGTDTDESSLYNTVEYTHFNVRGPEIQEIVESMGRRDADSTIEESSEDHALAIQQFLDFPALHTSRYDTFWAGMDVGLVDDPSEILIFAEYHPSGAERRTNRAQKKAIPLDGLSRLKLVTRISMRWIPAPLQADAIMWVIEHYKPKAFSMDSTGLGLPVFQELQKRAAAARLNVLDYGDDSKVPVAAVDARTRRNAQAREALTTIKGYNFGGKVICGFDEQKMAAMKAGATPQEIAEKCGLTNWVKQAATDFLRGIVDTQRHWLPMDNKLLSEWNAQKWQYGRGGVTAYGRPKTYSSVQVHTLDAARMAILGKELEPIEMFLREPPKARRPVYDHFVLG